MHQNRQKIENKKNSHNGIFKVIDLPPIHCEDALCVINLNKVSAIFKPIILYSAFFPESSHATVQLLCFVTKD